MAKFIKVCCGVREHNGEYGYIVKRVKSEPFCLDDNLAVYSQKGVYHLVDKETGLELNHFNYWEDIIKWYLANKNRYYMYRNSDYYREKVKKFKELEECK